MHKLLAVFLLATFVATTVDAAGVTIAWSPVGNPGNAPDPATGNGAVNYSYNIGTTDVTNSQYVQFLNAKDPTGANTLGLYDNTPYGYSTWGGISFNSGALNGNKYSVISGDGNHPVNFVNIYDTLRFTNWLNNGQGNGDTETGAYTLLGGTPTPSNELTITRSPGATVFLPNVNEWYKAANYDPKTNSYFQYPTSSNTLPTASLPTGAINSANYNGALASSPGGLGNLTDVGAYTGTASPYGAQDMVGNVSQWTETSPDELGYRIMGTSFADPTELLTGVFSEVIGAAWGEDQYTGFRVASIASVPEPSTGVLAAIACGMMWCWRKRFK